MSCQGNRILVVKLADIGDAVLSLPAIQAIRNSRPSCQLDVLTTSAGASVFQLSSAVDSVITLDKQRFDHVRGLISFSGISELIGLTRTLRGGRYDLVLILHHFTTAFGTRKFQALARATSAQAIAGLDNGRGTFLTHRAVDFGFGVRPEWQYALDVVTATGMTAAESRPALDIDNRVRASVGSLLQNRGVSRRFAVLHTEVGAFSPARAWPLSHFATVTRRLTESHGMDVVLVGVNREQTGLDDLRSIPGVHDLIGQTSFAELCAVIQRASLVIGGDSSVSHLAGALDRPRIALFGPSNVDAWAPYGSVSWSTTDDPSPTEGTAIALHRNMPCSPCIYTGFSLGRPSGCRSRTCMTELLPEDVLTAARHILEA